MTIAANYHPHMFIVCFFLTQSVILSKFTVAMALEITISHHQFSCASINSSIITEVTVREVEVVSETELEIVLDIAGTSCTKIIAKHSVEFSLHRKPL